MVAPRSPRFSLRRAGSAALVGVLVVVLGGVQVSVAHEPDPPTVDPVRRSANHPAHWDDLDHKVALVGDSLAVPAFNRFPDTWSVDLKERRDLAESWKILERMVNRRPDVLILALGSNDVGNQRTRMRHLVTKGASVTRSVPTVVWTTVKVEEVAPFYADGQWPQYALRWNRQVGRQRYVMDWAGWAADHPQYFLADGLHMNASGQKAYANRCKNLAILDALPTEDFTQHHGNTWFEDLLEIDTKTSGTRSSPRSWAAELDIAGSDTDVPRASD